MAEAAGALADATLAIGSLSSPAGSVGIRRDVEYDVVGVVRVSNSLNPLKLIKPKSVTGPPRDHVIGARRVATDAKTTHSLSRLVERKAAAKYVHTTNSFADHRIDVRTERLAVDRGRIETCGSDAASKARLIAIGNARVYGVAVLQAVEAAARLNGREQIGRRQCKSGRECAARGSGVVAKAEIIRSICFLGGNHTAAEPLGGELAAGECDRANGTIAVNDRAPHVKAKPAIWATRRRQRSDQGGSKL